VLTCAGSCQSGNCRPSETTDDQGVTTLTCTCGEGGSDSKCALTTELRQDGEFVLQSSRCSESDCNEDTEICSPEGERRGDEFKMTCDCVDWPSNSGPGQIHGAGELSRAEMIEQGVCSLAAECEEAVNETQPVNPRDP
jgi:hypothetical protein